MDAELLALRVQYSRRQVTASGSKAQMGTEVANDLRLLVKNLKTIR